jgi:hypothetical protein
MTSTLKSPAMLLGVPDFPDRAPISLKATARKPTAYVNLNTPRALPIDVASWHRQLQSEVPELTDFCADVTTWDVIEETPFPADAIRDFLRRGRRAIAKHPDAFGPIMLHVLQIKPTRTVGATSGRVQFFSPSEVWLTTASSYALHPGLYNLADGMFSALADWLAGCRNVDIVFRLPELTAHERLALSLPPS